MSGRLVILAAVMVIGCDPPVGAERVVVDAAAVDAAGVTLPDGGLDPVVFRRDLRPILERGDGPPAGCKRCHDPSSSAPQGFDLGGLDLSTLGGLRRGGFTSGARIVVPGDPASSILVQKLEGTYGRGARMPKDLTPLAPAEIALFARWIAEGARGTDDE